ncbi:MAG: sigma-70 family RNA polymerase sigma factor [bacterium]|nr:sigma-70 family RNA polymerase sigma factor [bacterium]
MSEIEERFARIYANVRDDLFAYIQRSMRQEDTSLDLLQDAFYNFCRIYQDREVPEDIQCRMYLFKIARNLMINYGKKVYNRRVDLVESYDDAPAINRSKSEPTPEDQVLTRMHAEESEQILAELLDTLKEDLRTVLLLRYQSNLRLEDIAGIMDLSISTISRMIQKAEQALVQEGRKRGLELP